MESRITERSSKYDNLEKMSIDEITNYINKENAIVTDAIAIARPSINRLIGEIENKLSIGGRLFYCGCGTGGRLAVLDTIEVQNTYGTDGNMIQALFPGGLSNLTHPKESKEDDEIGGWHMLKERNVSVHDIVVGLSASGTTPFVLATLKMCQENGIATGCVVNNPNSPISAYSDFPIEVITGPEFVTGSTRMKCGSSQKMILDMISTTVQIRLGRVEGNRMVNARLLNKKLIDRAVRIFMERNTSYKDYDVVKNLITKTGSVKNAEEAIRSKKIQ